MEHTSKNFARVLDSVRIPIQKFIDTGLYTTDWSYGRGNSIDITPVQVRRACRSVARELKRPFIEVAVTFDTGERVPDTARPGYSKWVPLPEPRWGSGTIIFPRLKYLSLLATPLILLAEGGSTRNWSSDRIWNFSVHDRQLWNEYYEFILNDPDCRKARRLTSGGNDV